LQNKAGQVTRTLDQLGMICGNAIQNARKPIHSNGVCGLQGRRSSLLYGDGAGRREVGMAGSARRDARDERLRKQREYQREYRKRIKASREPDRDEIARELLHYAITENLKHGREKELWVLADAVIDRLVARGFNAKAAENAFIGIVDRYEAGWTFQGRGHLLPQRVAATHLDEDGDGD
jgi:hypothetical protein